MRSAPVTIPLGPLDVRVPDHMVGPGALRQVENLVWLGTPERPVLSPPEGAGVVYAPSSGQEVLAAHEMPDGRLIACEPSALSILTPGGTWMRSELYDFGEADATRSMQVAHVYGRYVCAITCGEGAGAPCETLFVSESDGAWSARGFAHPSPPTYLVSFTEQASSEGFPASKWVMFRVAYVLKDGTITAAGPPVLAQPGVNTGGNTSWKASLSPYFLTGSGTPEDAPEGWPDVTGYVVYAGILEDAQVANFWFGQNPQAVSLPLYELVRTNDLAAATDPTGRTEESIVKGATLADSSLLRHEVRAGAAFAYNGRVVLGDITYTMRALDAYGVVAGGFPTDPDETNYGVRIGITYETPSGIVESIGREAYVAQGSAASVNIEGGILWATDPRARSFRVYAKAPASPHFFLAGEFDATLVPSSTLAYSFASGIDLTSTTGPAVANTQQGGTYAAPGEIVWSQEARPLDVPASNLLAASETEAIYGFASTSEPASEGQFGQYPILALLSGSIQALSVGSEPFITGRSPVSVRMGVVGRKAFCNVDGGLAVLTRSGAFLIAPRLQARPFSLPLHAQDVSADFLAELGSGASIAYLDSPLRDRREVWIASGGKVYVYCVDVQRWCIITRSRTGFAAPSALAYGIGADGSIYDETSGTTDAQEIALATAPLLGDPFTRKRLRRFGIRQRPMCDALDVRLSEPARPEAGDAESRLVAQADFSAGFDRHSMHTPQALVYEIVAGITGHAHPGQTIEGFEVRYEARQPHDTRD